MRYSRAWSTRFSTSTRIWWTGEEPARRRLGALGDTDDPLILFERLRRRQRDLERALAAIRREPVSVLRARRRFRPAPGYPEGRPAYASVRAPPTGYARGDPAGYRIQALRSGIRSDPRRTGRRAYARFSGEPVHPGHAASAASQVQRNSPRDWKRLAQKPLDDTRTAVANRVGRWNQILGEMGRGFATAERRRPFSDVRRPEITAAGLNALAAHPLYARFWRIGWKALRRGVYRMDPEDRLPLSPTWEIYERWCFVALARKLREWLPNYDWTNTGLNDSDRRRLTGRADGHRITLHLQRTFPKTKGEQAPESWSISGRFRPDLVLTSQSADGPRRFVVLDAKYRAAESAILSGMTESAHPYADALRWGYRRPERTLLLVPNATQAEWLTRTDYVDRHRVGVVALRPDIELPDWFRGLLTDPPRPSVSTG